TGTCPVVLLEVAVAAGFLGNVHAIGDLLGLLADGDGHATGLAVEADVGGVETDFHEFPAYQLWDLHIATGPDLAHHVDDAGGDHGFDGDAGQGVRGQQGIEDGV